MILAAILVARPAKVLANVLLPNPKTLLRKARKADLYLLPYPAPLVGVLSHQPDPALGQEVLIQLPASVGEVPEQPVGETIVQARLGQQLPRQPDLRQFCAVSS